MLTRFTAKQFEIFAMNMLLDKGFPGHLPLKLWKVEYACRRYDSDSDMAETVSIEYNTNYTKDVEDLSPTAGATHNYAQDYYNLSIKADDSNNPFNIDLYISAQVVYSYTDEDKDLLQVIGKVQQETQTTTRSYLLCGG